MGYISCIGLRESLLQVRDRVQFPRNEASKNPALWPIGSASKSLTSTETWYSNIEREDLGILHGLEKFHHYCFSHKVNVIPGHKLLVAIFNQDIISLSQRVQRVLLCIHQYSVRILKNPTYSCSS